MCLGVVTLSGDLGKQLDPCVHFLSFKCVCCEDVIGVSSYDSLWHGDRQFHNSVPMKGTKVKGKTQPHSQALSSLLVFFGIAQTSVVGQLNFKR